MLRIISLLLMTYNLYAFSYHLREYRSEILSLYKKEHLLLQTQALYKKEHYELLWKKKENIYDVLQAIKKSKFHGLNPKKYHLKSIKNAIREKKKVLLDLLLSDAFIRLGRDLHFSQSKIVVNNKIVQEKKRAFQITQKLLKALATTQVQTTLFQLTPQFPMYKKLYFYMKRSNPNLQIAKKIAINMDRLRLYGDEKYDNYMIVNIPEFRLHLFNKSKEIYTMRVIVGKNQHKTPLLEGNLQKVIINPNWYIPQSIAREKVLPKMQKDSGYLEKKGIEVFRRKDFQAVSVDVDELKNHLNKYILRQKKSVKNPLGTIKFMFENEKSIYLHDTPSKYIFKYKRRAYSSGCVRLAEPYTLASYLLDKDKSVLEKRVASHKSIVMTPEKNTHIYILYNTLWFDKKNRLRFYDDIYALDTHL